MLLPKSDRLLKYETFPRCLQEEVFLCELLEPLFSNSCELINFHLLLIGCSLLLLFSFFLSVGDLVLQVFDLALEG